MESPYHTTSQPLPASAAATSVLYWRCWTTKGVATSNAACGGVCRWVRKIWAGPVRNPAIHRLYRPARGRSNLLRTLHVPLVHA